MAGSILLINQNESINKFEKKITVLTDYLNQDLKHHFTGIEYYRPSKDIFLANLKKNNIKKYYYHEDGSWITYEGIVFRLNETKVLESEALFHLYREYGKNFANELDGHFVIKIYNSANDEILIINDFIKNKTNFYLENNEYIMFTPLLISTAIIKKPEIDSEALNEFMWRYYILSDKTLLKGVKRLKAGSIYKIKNNTIDISQYWKWPSKYTDIKFEDAVKKTQNSMQETANLIFQVGKPCIDFTQGQDSRQIISGFTSQNLPFTTSIFGQKDFYEVQNVKKISKNHSIENYNIQLKQDFLQNPYNWFEKSVILGSCEEPGYLLGRILYMRESQKQYGNPILNGMDGHFYKNGLWDEIYTFNFYREPANFNIEIFLKLRALSKNYDDAIFTDKYLRTKELSRDYFTQIAKNSIKNYLSSPVSIQVDKFDLNHWLNFGIAANSTCNMVADSISPLLLRRNLEFALTIPVQWKFNLSKYQRQVVYNLDKNLAAEKTDFAGVNMVPKNLLTIIPFYFKYFYFQSSRLRNKIKSKLRFSVKTHLQEAWNYLPVYQNILNNKSIQTIENLDNLVNQNIINKENWNQYINKLQNENINNIENHELALKLLSVELLLATSNKIFKKLDNLE